MLKSRFERKTTRTEYFLQLNGAHTYIGKEKNETDFCEKKKKNVKMHTEPQKHIPIKQICGKFNRTQDILID